MTTCNVRGCESDQTERLTYTKPDKHGRAVKFFADVCDNCTELLKESNVSVSFWRCGNLAWVEEMWQEDENYHWIR